MLYTDMFIDICGGVIFYICMDRYTQRIAFHNVTGVRYFAELISNIKNVQDSLTM